MQTQPIKRGAGSRSYARIWRWHFFAGLLLTPTLTTLAITGLIYLFKPQVEPALYQQWLEVPPSSQHVSAQAQLEAALDAHPGAQPRHVVMSKGPGQATQVLLRNGSGESLRVYVNPHTGEVVASQHFDRTLMQLTKNIHGSLLLGKPGEFLMELTAGWALVLLTTGLYLWWPRNRTGWAGILWPRLRSKGRAWWKDLHAVTAFYLSAFILLFLLTGLVWTAGTGTLISEIGRTTGQGAPPGFGTSPFRSESDGRQPVTLDTLHAIARERLPANASPEIVLPGVVDQHHHGLDHGLGDATNSGTPAAIIRWKAPQPQDRAYLHVDMYSGEVLADYRWNDFGVVGKLTAMSVALHEGTWFGVWNQVLNSAIALAVLWLALSGVILWWKRRPARSYLSPPKATPDSGMPRSLKVLVGLTCVIVPVLGVALLVVILCDFAVRQVLVKATRASRRRPA